VCRLIYSPSFKQYHKAKQKKANYGPMDGQLRLFRNFFFLGNLASFEFFMDNLASFDGQLASFDFDFDFFFLSPFFFFLSRISCSHITETGIMIAYALIQ
jgi:hypothetical protein